MADANFKCLLDEFNRQEVTRLAPVFAIFGCVILIGCLGNATSLYIYFRNFNDSNSRCFLIMLSAVELFSSSVSVPMEIYNLMIHFNFTNDRLCKGVVFTEICQVEISSCLLILIAVDRWRKVCHPFDRQVSVTMAKVLCAMLVPFACLIATPSLAIYGSREFFMDPSTISDSSKCYDERTFGVKNSSTTNSSETLPLQAFKCSINNAASESIWPTLYSGFFWCLSFIGTGIMSAMYSQIIRTIKLQDRKREQSTRQRSSNQSSAVSKYVKPIYRPQESIDMDCETAYDNATRISHMPEAVSSNTGENGMYINQSGSTRKDGNESAPKSVTHEENATRYKYTGNENASEKCEASTASDTKISQLPKIRIITPAQSSSHTRSDGIDQEVRYKSSSSRPDIALLHPDSLMTQRRSHNNTFKRMNTDTVTDDEDLIEAISRNHIDNIGGGPSKLQISEMADVRANGKILFSKHVTFSSLFVGDTLTPIEENDTNSGSRKWSLSRHSQNDKTECHVGTEETGLKNLTDETGVTLKETNRDDSNDETGVALKETNEDVSSNETGVALTETIGENTANTLCDFSVAKPDLYSKPNMETSFQNQSLNRMNLREPRSFYNMCTEEGVLYTEHLDTDKTGSEFLGSKKDKRTQNRFSHSEDNSYAQKQSKSDAIYKRGEKDVIASTKKKPTDNGRTRTSMHMFSKQVDQNSSTSLLEDTKHIQLTIGNTSTRKERAKSNKNCKTEEQIVSIAPLEDTNKLMSGVGNNYRVNENIQADKDGKTTEQIKSIKPLEDTKNRMSALENTFTIKENIKDDFDSKPKKHTTPPALLEAKENLEVSSGIQSTNNGHTYTGIDTDQSVPAASAYDKKGKRLQRQSTLTKRQGRSRNVTIIMLAITVSNVICFLPYLILSLLRSLVTDFEINLDESERVAYSLFVRSMYFKSVLNPLIYGMFDNRFRQVLFKLVKGRN